jgi:hypothetical protein
MEIAVGASLPALISRIRALIGSPSNQNKAANRTTKIKPSNCFPSGSRIGEAISPASSKTVKSRC